MRIESSFVEDNKYRNYYEGYQWLQFPSKKRCEMWTSRASGHLKTPSYGEPFDEDNFEYNVDYEYHFYPPSSLGLIVDLYPNLDLLFVLHFYMDVYPGQETIYIDFRRRCIKLQFADKGVGRFKFGSMLKLEK